MNPRWLLPGGFGLAILGIVIVYRKRLMSLSFVPTISPRQAVVNAALGEVGSNDTMKYWSLAAPGSTIGKGISWCGAFALWALKQAGLALNIFWVFGKGFLSGNLPITKDPQPGDVAYVDKPYQHHAIVQSVNPDGTINLINGNGENGKVSLSTTPRSHVTAFYSIQPLIPT
jgi:hypothetical protein